MKIKSLDLLVVTAVNIEKTISFYTQILGMELITFREGRKVLLFGDQKINLNGNIPHPKCGSLDFCLIVETAMILKKTK